VKRGLLGPLLALVLAALAGFVLGLDLLAPPPCGETSYGIAWGRMLLGRCKP